MDVLAYIELVLPHKEAVDVLNQNKKICLIMVSCELCNFDVYTEANLPIYMQLVGPFVPTTNCSSSVGGCIIPCWLPLVFY